MPPMRIEFSVPGVRGKARPVVTRHGTFTPKETRDYEVAVAKAFSEGLFHAYAPGAWPMDGTCEVFIAAHYPVPKSWSRKKKLLAYAGGIAPGKPDIDNVVKLILDGLNGVAFNDDRQVTKLAAEKHFSATEGGHVDVIVEVQA